VRGEIHIKILVKEHEGKRSFRKSRRRWEGCINVDLKETECKKVDFTELAQARLSRRALVVP
jgi:hypothetical protein